MVPKQILLFARPLCVCTNNAFSLSQNWPGIIAHYARDPFNFLQRCLAMTVKVRCWICMKRFKIIHIVSNVNDDQLFNSKLWFTIFRFLFNFVRIDESCIFNVSISQQSVNNQSCSPSFSLISLLLNHTNLWRDLLTASHLTTRN